jgi:hypothetical protein
MVDVYRTVRQFQRFLNIPKDLGRHYDLTLEELSQKAAQADLSADDGSCKLIATIIYNPYKQIQRIEYEGDKK